MSIYGESLTSVIADCWHEAPPNETVLEMSIRVAACIVAEGWTSPAEVERAKAEALRDAADVIVDEATASERLASRGYVDHTRREFANGLYKRASAVEKGTDR